MRRNNQTNRLIKWLVAVADFLLLNTILIVFSRWHPNMAEWDGEEMRHFLLFCNMGLFVAEWRYHTIIHERLPSSGQVLKRIVLLTMTWMITAYLLQKTVGSMTPVGWLMVQQGGVLFFALLITRLAERMLIKWYRQRGGNTRRITFVGSDSELVALYDQLVNNPTTGYRAMGYYGDKSLTDRLECLGSLEDFVKKIDRPEELSLGDELYLCVPHQEKNLVMRVSRMCDHQMVRFYYVPVSSESFGLNLKRELFEDREVFTTYENPLQNPLNKAAKRLLDIVVSVICLLLTAILFPFIWLKIKCQSPGPVFFRQERTGLDGKTFMMLKFRSMSVNPEADTLQATKNDPRKFPFGNFMRRTNLDEAPQFWNVLKGDMSVVGPRPHMLKHTEMYSKLIDKYMVRHFVKPGMTGWAQVTGYRGETKELWQMEGRVKRDIWYMEHWSIWLDIRILWITLKALFVHDKNAY